MAITLANENMDRLVTVGRWVNRLVVVGLIGAVGFQQYQLQLAKAATEQVATDLATLDAQATEAFLIMMKRDEAIAKAVSEMYAQQKQSGGI